MREGVEVGRGHGRRSGRGRRVGGSVRVTAVVRVAIAVAAATAIAGVVQGWQLVEDCTLGVQRRQGGVVARGVLLVLLMLLLLMLMLMLLLLLLLLLLLMVMLLLLLRLRRVTGVGCVVVWLAAGAVHGHVIAWLVLVVHNGRGFNRNNNGPSKTC